MKDLKKRIEDLELRMSVYFSIFHDEILSKYTDREISEKLDKGIKLHKFSKSIDELRENHRNKENVD